MLVTVDSGHYTVDGGKWTLEFRKIEKWKLKSGKKSGQCSGHSGQWSMENATGSADCSTPEISFPRLTFTVMMANV